MFKPFKGNKGGKSVTREERDYAIECIEDIISIWESYDGNSVVIDESDIKVLKEVVEELKKCGA